MINVAETRKKLEKMDHDELVEYALSQEISKNNYLQSLTLMRMKKFGSTSEKTSPEMVPLFNEIEKELDNTSPEELIEPKIEVTKKKKKKTKQKETKTTGAVREKTGRSAHGRDTAADPHFRAGSGGIYSPFRRSGQSNRYEVGSGSHAGRGTAAPEDSTADGRTLYRRSKS